MQKYFQTGRDVMDAYQELNKILVELFNDTMDIER